MWRFEKRDFWAPDHARRIGFQPMPPKEWSPAKKWTLQDGFPVDQDLFDIEASRWLCDGVHVGMHVQKGCWSAPVHRGAVAHKGP